MKLLLSLLAILVCSLSLTAATTLAQPAEGNIYIDTDTGMVFLTLYGSLRHVPNIPTLHDLFVPLDNLLIRIRNTDLQSLPVGTPLVDGAQLLQDSLTGYKYLLDVENGVFKRRRISTDAQFNKYKFNTDMVVHVSHAVCLAIPEGRPI